MLSILSDKWWAFYFDEYSFSIFIVLMLIWSLLGTSTSSVAVALQKWLTTCFPMLNKKWDGKIERRKVT